MFEIWLLGKTIEFAGKTIPQRDIQKFLEEEAENYLSELASEVVRKGITKILATNKNIATTNFAGEFEEVFKHDTLVNAMNHLKNRMDKDVYTPTLKNFLQHTNINDDRFYAVPKKLLDVMIRKKISHDLENAAGLNRIYEEVFDKELDDKKRSTLIEFAAKTGSEIALKELSAAAEPRPKLWPSSQVSVHSVGKSLVFWGVNKDLTWDKQDEALPGHFYFERGVINPDKSHLRTIEQLKPALEAHLLKQDLKQVYKQLLEKIQSDERISYETRNAISIDKRQ